MHLTPEQIAWMQAALVIQKAQDSARRARKRSVRLAAMQQQMVRFLQGLPPPSPRKPAKS